MSIGETIKEHPKATVAFVVVAVLVLFLLFRGGSSGTSAQSGASGTDVQAATDAYVAQQQASTQSQAIAASVQANQDQLGAQIAALGIQSQTTNNANNLQANVDLAKINADQQTNALQISTAGKSTDLANTLSAQVAQAGFAAQTRQQEIASNTTIASNQIVAGALVQQSTNQLQANLAEIGLQQHQIDQNAYVAIHTTDQAAYVAINNAQIAADAYKTISQTTAGVYSQQIAANQNVQTQSWLSKIFG